eukprot:NODE_451_length_1676_cov_167.413030_g330_i0.p1 GENE.NODE_451_length_1676_cov_167.413030_g330_i0~~NODE_451_length_1676_cov_167.413030_g330_i0.p1  ORF type:complete len:511 (+),score=149.66 NODE_451_length_1676_cov_167.413030_g330_i0:65-1597(+)
MMMRRGFGLVQRRCISGVSPMLYLRGAPAATATADPNDVLRSRISGLRRFAKTQLSQVSGQEKAALEADLNRYDSYLASMESFVGEVNENLSVRLELTAKLDRYPDVSIAQITEIADRLEAKLQKAIATLETQPVQNIEIDPEYWKTSKFHILQIHEGCVATLPAGDVPPGAVEILKCQIIETIVDGEEVYLEVEDFDEDKQVLWFKSDVVVPADAEVMWSYQHQVAGQPHAGTQWLTGDDVVVSQVVPGAVPAAAELASNGDTVEGDWAVEVLADEQAPEAPTPPAPSPKPDMYTPILDKMTIAENPETKLKFREALLEYQSHFDVDAEYESHWDREVVEAKRDRYLNALAAAQERNNIPPLNPVSLTIQHIIAKCEMVDALRQQEYYIAEQQLLARLHERRLAGEPITEAEELDYMPHVRDDVHLEQDYADVTYGRYIWQMFPHLEADENALIQDRAFADLPEERDPLAKIMQASEKQLPTYKKLEQRVWDTVETRLALERKSELATL